MKKFLTLLLGFIMCFGVFGVVGCNAPASNGGVPTLSFFTPDGAPALAVAKFIKDQEDFGIKDAKFSYKVVSSSEIGPILSKQQADFVVVPVNAASKLYKANTNNPYVMTAVLTHGNLYLMSSNQTQSLQDLKGQVVGVIGQGLVPDLTFKAILSDAGLLSDVVYGDTATPNKITLRYFEKAENLIPLLKQGVLSVGLLPEPACTNLSKVASNHTWTRLDIQQLYDAETQSYPQAVLMVRKAVYQAYKTQIDAMGSLFAENLQWVKTNTAEAVKAVNAMLPQGVSPSLVAENITSTVVDNCKIFYQASTLAQTEVINFINKLIAIDPTCARSITQDFFA